MDQLPSYYQQLNDPSLWEAFKGGNEEAFKYIYDAKVYALYSYGHRITSDNGLVEDCIQDLFADLWEKNTAFPAPTLLNFIFLRPYAEDCSEG